MDRKRFATCVPRAAPSMARHPIIEFSSGYVKRAAGQLPMQGGRHPWRVRQNYVKDLATMAFSPIDEALEFGARRQP